MAAKLIYNLNNTKINSHIDNIIYYPTHNMQSKKISAILELVKSFLAVSKCFNIYVHGYFKPLCGYYHSNNSAIFLKPLHPPDF